MAEKVSSPIEKQEMLVHANAFKEEARSYVELVMQYRCAIREVETKLQILNDEFTIYYKRNPFESIKSRIKSVESTIEKLQRRELPVTVASMEENLFDIAGIRVICSFPEDIYMLAKLLMEQDDIQLVQVKDYIKNPKDNGYRSLHLILDVPIYLSKKKKYMKVEVQFRTIAMDFWASIEHKLKYKKDIDNAAAIVQELKMCADIISEMDYKMQSIHHEIQGYNSLLDSVD